MVGYFPERHQINKAPVLNNSYLVKYWAVLLEISAYWQRLVCSQEQKILSIVWNYARERISLKTLWLTFFLMLWATNNRERKQRDANRCKNSFLIFISRCLLAGKIKQRFFFYLSFFPIADCEFIHRLSSNWPVLLTFSRIVLFFVLILWIQSFRQAMWADELPLKKSAAWFRVSTSILFRMWHQ